MTGVLTTVFLPTVDLSLYNDESQLKKRKRKTGDGTNEEDGKI